MELTWVEQLNWLFGRLIEALRPHLGDVFFAMYLRQELGRARPVWIETFMRLWEENYTPYAAEQFINFKEDTGSTAHPPSFWGISRDEIRAGVEMRVDQILRTTENRWTAEGPPDTEQEMLSTIRDDLTQRRKIIAELEVVLLTEMATEAAVIAVGHELFWKIWQSMEDDLVRDSHEALNGYEVPVNSVFPNGLRYPGDTSTGDPKEYMGCRCWTRYRPRGAQHAEESPTWSAIQGPSLPIEYRIGPDLPFGSDG